MIGCFAFLILRLNPVSVSGWDFYYSCNTGILGKFPIIIDMIHNGAKNNSILIHCFAVTKSDYHLYEQSRWFYQLSSSLYIVGIYEKVCVEKRNYSELESYSAGSKYFCVLFNTSIIREKLLKKKKSQTYNSSCDCPHYYTSFS